MSQLAEAIADSTLPTYRGRVVMLVHNPVDGDSRVQKQAESAAAAGWHVTLVGLQGPASKVLQWKIGEADVRLVPVLPHILGQQSRLRRSVLHPLAYRPGPTAGYRNRLIESKHRELLVRLGRLVDARRSGSAWRARAGHLAVLPSRVTLKVQRPWVRFRVAETKRLEAARIDEKALATRLHIWYRSTFWRSRSWRHLDPALLDLEVAFGPVVDRLQPDIIHANDFNMIGVGARAKMRAALRGRSVKLVWDAHELVSGIVPPQGKPRWLPAQIAHEREYARYADAVVTVSPMLADLLVSHHRLRTRPTVVMNSPRMSVPAEDVPDLRTTCGLDADTPVLAYSGGIARQRGLRLVIDALPQLPGVHLVMLSLHPYRSHRDANTLKAQAEELGVADRVHILPYLPHHQVVPFLTGANAAVSPLEHTPNHEVALTNKFFEYAQARLPQLVSDVRASAEMITSKGIGEVFRAGDVDDFVRAARVVLADLPRYSAGYDAPGLLDEWTWEHQSSLLDEVYSSLHES